MTTNSAPSGLAGSAPSEQEVEVLDRLLAGGSEAWVAMGHSETDLEGRLLAGRNAELLEWLRTALPGLLATARDGERLDAIERGDVQIQCMGTDIRYFNAWGDETQVFTTAGTTGTLRETIDAAMTAAAARSTGSVDNG